MFHFLIAIIVLRQKRHELERLASRKEPIEKEVRNIERKRNKEQQTNEMTNQSHLGLWSPKLLKFVRAGFFKK